VSVVRTDKTFYYDNMAASADWDTRTNTYETERRVQLIFGQLLRGVDLKGLRMLDGGSGGGHFSAAATRRGAQVTSVDVGANLIRQVQKRAGSRGVIASILELPFPDGAFDLVVSTEVIEHTPEPERAVRELCRVVKPGGMLVLTSPNRLWQSVVRFATRAKLRHYAGHENFLWPERARGLVEGSGLRVEHFQGFNALPLFRPVFEPLLALGDRLGEIAPSSFVNFALVARRPG
jgi:2-polyprenyl-3-methyl-5-hydroxy-6-metoxy-1,4-benzoquinol methylase